MTTHDGPGMGRRVRRGIEAGKRKYSGSSADVLWRRLNSVDFLNQGIIFASTLLLCAFPFLIVADALDGQSTTRGPGRRLGLNRQADDDAGHLFTSSHATVASVTGFAWVFLVLSGFSVAASLQGLTSNDQKYGPIGIVFALMSYLIAIGVVVIMGAVTGLVWQERGLSFRAAFRKLRPNRN